VSADEVAHAGAAGDGDHANIAGGAAVAVGHEGQVLLTVSQYVADRPVS